MSTVSLIYGANHVDLRGPTSRSGTVQMLQPDEYSSGWARVGYPSRGAVHTLTLDYQRMSTTERTAVEAFWTIVDATAKQITYADAITGNSYSCWLDKPELGFEEVSYNLFRSTLNLWSQSAFFTFTGGAPTINDADTIITNLQYPASHAQAGKQPLTRLSDNSVVIYDKTTLTRKTRTVTIMRRTAAQMGKIISFFSAAAEGTRNKFNWTFDGSVKSTRFASTLLSWKQSAISSILFDVTVALEEDL